MWSPGHHGTSEKEDPPCTPRPCMSGSVMEWMRKIPGDGKEWGAKCSPRHPRSPRSTKGGRHWHIHTRANGSNTTKPQKLTGTGSNIQEKPKASNPEPRHPASDQRRCQAPTKRNQLDACSSNQENSPTATKRANQPAQCNTCNKNTPRKRGRTNDKPKTPLDPRCRTSRALSNVLNTNNVYIN
ncbi:hypothetical protein XENORESO_001375 [Xenotaenia resolanae]|uniref:Uncharacterized protein n=1 Tax=Xenotaenia resolanae TaxID=208358 RepID=A0ABV0VWX5_9TELE